MNKHDAQKSDRLSGNHFVTRRVIISGVLSWIVEAILMLTMVDPW